MAGTYTGRCFCGTVEDRSSLAGAEAERWRRWDSCFTLDFSYLHGGAGELVPALVPAPNDSMTCWRCSGVNIIRA